MRILKYLSLMAFAVVSGLCGMLYWNPLPAVVALAAAAWAGWEISKNQ